MVLPERGVDEMDSSSQLQPPNPFEDVTLTEDSNGLHPRVVPPEQRKEYTVEVSKVLVCSECSVYYDHKEDWNVCPKCGESLDCFEKAE